MLGGMWVSRVEIIVNTMIEKKNFVIWKKKWIINEIIIKNMIKLENI